MEQEYSLFCRFFSRAANRWDFFIDCINNRFWNLLQKLQSEKICAFFKEKTSTKIYLKSYNFWRIWCFVTCICQKFWLKIKIRNVFWITFSAYPLHFHPVSTKFSPEISSIFVRFPFSEVDDCVYGLLIIAFWCLLPKRSAHLRGFWIFIISCIRHFYDTIVNG